MELTTEHRAIMRTMQSFVEKEINPYVNEWEKAGAFPAHEVFKKMGDLGLLGINKPEQYGGMGLETSYAVAATEALGNATCGGVPLAIGVQTDMATPALARFGTDALREEFLRPAIAGDMVTSIAVSETHAGSDVAAIKTNAKKDGDDYIINGSKMWITNSSQADYLCLLAVTSDDSVHKNKSLIIVPTNTKGVTIGEKIDKLGMRSSDTAPVYFDDVRVPQRYRIGEEGAGFTMQMQQFQEERLWIAALVLRQMEQCIESTVEYTQDRKLFGQSVLDFQIIQYRLAEMQTEIEALRALVYRAAGQMDQGEDMTLLASMCKLKGGRLVREVSDTCLQYWGGNGYTWENPVSQIWRDGRLMSIGAGTDETILSIIAKYMGLTKKNRS